MEDLTYRYKRNEAGQIMQNRLYHVNETDIVHNTLYTDDIEDQGAFPTDTENSVWNEDFNYGYTEIGELLRDNAEDIEQIVWRVDSKIAYIYRSDESTKKELGFEYDAMGNRIAKHIYSAVGVWEKSTFYVRDASGNVMATYEEIEEPLGELKYACIERPIYGSSRLGMETTLIEMVEANAPSSTDAQRNLGYKQYEISNHLGNVLAVVNDMKLPEFDGTLIVNYSAVMVSATDYSPFGVGLYGRSWSSEVYRYGFNGQEKDDESFSGALDFGARVLDSRLGRWLSLDPYSNQNHFWSDFTYAADNPNLIIDIDGKWWGITTIYAEFQASVGLCYGVNYLKRTGFSVDEVGTTHFTVSSALYIVNQNLDEGQNGQPIFGATIAACVGIAFSNKETFDQLVGGRITSEKNGVTGVAAGAVLDYVLQKIDDPNISYRALIGIAFSEFGFEISLGAQEGVAIIAAQTNVDESISVTEEQDDMIDDITGYPCQQWSVADTKNPEYNGATGEVSGFVSTIVASGIDTKIEIHCGSMKDDKGNIVPDNVWYTFEYQNAAKDANEKNE